MENHIRQKTSIHASLLFSVCLLLAFGGLLYLANFNFKQFKEQSVSRITVCIPDSENSCINNLLQQIETSAQAMTTRFTITAVFMFLGSVLIATIGSYLFVKRKEAKNSQTFSSLLDNNEMEDDEADNEFISGVEDIIQEDETGTLAHSYNKMVEALQRINELEKIHSVELADANRQLQNEIIERERAEIEIRRLSTRLMSSMEEARKELARDLHDEFGQTLAALHLNAETVLNSMPSELADQNKRIQNLIELTEQLGDQIRNLSSELRPDLLDDLGLIPTLEWYINEFMTKRDDIRIEFQAVGFKKRIATELEVVLYRIFQECLNNIVKHAKANHVTVVLTYSHPKVIFMMKDNGIGFDTRQRSDGIGLLGMKERVTTAKGQIEIRSAIQKGTMVRVEIPVIEGEIRYEQDQSVYS